MAVLQSVNGKAPSNAQIGDSIVTNGGTWQITGQNADGSWISEKVSDTSKNNYSGSSSSSGGSPSSSGSSGSSGSSSGGVPIGTPRPNDFTGSANGVTVNGQDQQAIIDQMNANSAAWWDAKTQEERDALHQQNQYLAGLLGGSVSYDSSSGKWSGTAAPSQQAQKADVGQFTDLLDKWMSAAQQQSQQANDYAVSQGVNELTRAEEDAKAQFQTQRDQIAAAEAVAKDNQALYAEARGDRGGIGGAQYDSIMNTAMQEQAAVNQAQTKLSTDTARQIADLRAQGEFQKADDLLELSQNYLSQLISLQQWAMQYNLSVDQFNASLQQWQKEFELSVGQLMGSYGGSPTLGAQQFEYEKEWNQQQLELSQQQDLQSKLASAGSTLLGAGIMPSDSQLAAMGMDKAQAEAYIKALTIMNSSSGGGGGSSGGGGGSSGGDQSTGQITLSSTMAGRRDQLYIAAALSGMDPETFIDQSYSDYGFDRQSKLADGYYEWLDEGGTSDASFGGSMSSLRGALGNDYTAMANSIVSKNWDNWSGSQKLDAMKVMSGYGFSYVP